MELITNETEISFSDMFKYGDIELNYAITKNKELRVSVEDCARVLGVTDTKKLKDGKDSTTVRWNRVYEDLVGIERIATLGDFKTLDKDAKKELRDNMKKMTLSERELYLWSFRVESEQGKSFRDWLATTVLPNLREHGFYVGGMENMTLEEIKVIAEERVEGFILRKFGIGVRKSLTDAIKQNLNPSKEDNYIYAKLTNLLYNVIFGMDCQQYKNTIGIEKKDSLRDALKSSEDYDKLDDIAKAESFMCSLLMSGISDEETLKTMLTTWYENFKSKNRGCL